MERAVAGRGAAERALGTRESELEGYTAASTRYDGTHAGVIARIKSAEALDYYGRGDEAAGALESIVSRFPKSIWAARAQMRLAEMRGASAKATELYLKIADAYPQSIFWVEARMRLAETYWKIADGEEDADKKKEMRAKARAACEEIPAHFPSCPEVAKAREFLSTHTLL
jgi:TolA-binding protein